MIEELIDRSLTQVTSKRSYGGVKWCRVHDLLQDLCIKVSAKDMFLEIHSDTDPSESSVIRARRLSIQDSICKLQLLEVFDMGSSSSETTLLPKGIWRMNHLRY
ncbi:hypothetical protein FNV43_RR01899 [Rhamnella rubrinervis]|uniref:Uncharacterized protein n=1 Tax=Rhamnella rubrinervis TaxID=2594499 RepID=A0A8K0HQP5_9ROSA|nr:hypothetical protein FNV43_RR01899 [Rhamnella rubrinervis]